VFELFSQGSSSKNTSRYTSVCGSLFQAQVRITTFSPFPFTFTFPGDNFPSVSFFAGSVCSPSSQICSRPCLSLDPQVPHFTFAALLAPLRPPSSLICRDGCPQPFWLQFSFISATCMCSQSRRIGFVPFLFSRRDASASNSPPNFPQAFWAFSEL